MLSLLPHLAVHVAAFANNPVFHALGQIFGPLVDLLRGSAARHPRRDRQLGLVDHHPDHHRAAHPHAAHLQAVPLGAGHAEAPAQDQGAPAQVQERQAQAPGRDDEALPGVPGQPVRLVLAAPAADADLHLPVLRDQVHTRDPAFELLDHPFARAAVLAAVRLLHPVAAGLDRAHDAARDRQAAEVAHAGHADHVHLHPLPLPLRAHALLGDDQPVDDHAAAHHSQDGPKARAAAGRRPSRRGASCAH